MQLIDCVLSMIVLMYWTLLLQCVAVFSCVFGVSYSRAPEYVACLHSGCTSFVTCVYRTCARS